MSERVDRAWRAVLNSDAKTSVVLSVATVRAVFAEADRYRRAIERHAASRGASNGPGHDADAELWAVLEEASMDEVPWTKRIGHDA